MIPGPTEPLFAKTTRPEKRDDEYRVCPRRVSMFIPRRTSFISGVGPGETFVGAGAVRQGAT